MQAYPLQWPPTWPRSKRKEGSRLGKISIEQGKNEILHELKLMGAKEIIISTNLKLRIDGYPYSNQRQPDDVGVAVYFKFKGHARCIPCDDWNKIEHNMRAIAKTVGALRGIGMVDAAFTWWKVLGVPVNATFDQVEQAYRDKAFEYHPDRGGDHQKMAEINSAMETARIAAQA